MGRGKRNASVKSWAKRDIPYHLREDERKRLEQNPELARCCPHPDFAQANEARPPYRQRCRTCSTWHERGLSLEVARTLEQHPFARCAHDEVQELDFLVTKDMRQPLQCLRCHLCFRTRPKPYQAGEDYLDLHKEYLEEWSEKSGLAELARAKAREQVVAETRSKPRARPSGLAG